MRVPHCGSSLSSDPSLYQSTLVSWAGFPSTSSQYRLTFLHTTVHQYSMYTVHQGGYSSQYRLTFLHTTVHQYSTQYTRGYTAHSTGSRSCTPQYISEELLFFNVLVIRAGCGANFPRQRITGWAVPPPYSYGKCTDTTVTLLLCIVGWRRGNICADHISGNSDKPPLLARWRKNYWRDAQLRFIEP